jgi:Ni/Fe-hydrogenase subunit HybB-like protein
MAEGYTPPSGAPAAPGVYSPNFPDQNSWYQVTRPKFTWNVPADVTAVRVAGVMGVLSIVLNRLNMSVIAFNWKLPVRYVPRWQELLVSVTLVTLGIVLFRLIVNRMPIMREDPAFPQEH